MLRLITEGLLRYATGIRSLENVRFLSRTCRILEKASSSPPAETKPSATQPPSEPSADATNQIFKKKSHTLTNFDKRILVSVGKFKSIDEVPDTVAYACFLFNWLEFTWIYLIVIECSSFFFRHETLDRARDKWRVKMCIYMMIATLLICIVQIIRGKNAAERGESVVNSNLEWHRHYNEAAAKKEKETK